MAQQIVEALERSHIESSRAAAVRQAGKQPEKESEEAASSANTFQSDGGEQSIAQGSNAIGTQINNYYSPSPQESKPQPTPAAKIESMTVVVDQNNQGDYTTITDALKAVKAGGKILIRPGVYKEGIVIDKQVEIIGDGKRDDIVIEIGVTQLKSEVQSLQQVEF
jgi:pectin methylesterase-like acyl-CoA thioesterase